VQDAAVSANEEARGDVAIHGLWEKGTVKVKVAAARPAEKRHPERIGRTGACWLLVPNKLNGTCMSKEEFFDNACLR